MIKENWETNFGGMMSTSNEIIEDECKINVEKGEIFFTADLKQ